MPKRIDLTGQKFGKLTVIGFSHTEKGIAYWSCKCECGNETIVCAANLRHNITKSCGCLQREAQQRLKNFTDKTGTINGKLTILSLAGFENGSAMWNCKCECGNECVVSTRALHKKKDCGAHKSQHQSEALKYDLIGQIFGHLTVVAPEQNKKGHTTWKCKCDCGRECIVHTGHLRNGHTRSCGQCLRISVGETLVEEWLVKHCIPYEREKRFIGCIDVCKLPFDFFLWDRGIAIEFDGILHYEVTSLNNDLEKQHKHDLIKNAYCEQNDIILLRIPYWEMDNIDSILSEWILLDDKKDAA